MPEPRPAKTTFQNPLPVRDLLVSGKELGLPMVDYIAANHRFNAGRMSWHSHEGHEILLLLSGTTSYEFRGGRHASLKGGHIMVVPRGTVHRGLNDTRQASTLCAIVFNPTHARTQTTPFTRKECDWLAKHFGKLRPSPSPMSAAIRQHAKTLHRLIRQHASTEKTEGLAASMRLTVASIIIDTARGYDSTQTASTARVAHDAIHYLEHHYMKPVPMDHLAKQAGCSRPRLFAIFKQETGMSPNDWLQRHRVKVAAELLRTTNRKLEDIASSVGFSSAQYCCQVFRKYTGKTPGEHRAS